jgi:hypothetical protein
VIHFFSFTGRKEMNKSAIETMLNRITIAGSKIIFQMFTLKRCLLF